MKSDMLKKSDLIFIDDFKTDIEKEKALQDYKSFLFGENDEFAYVFLSNGALAGSVFDFFGEDAVLKRIDPEKVQIKIKILEGLLMLIENPDYFITKGGRDRVRVEILNELSVLVLLNDGFFLPKRYKVGFEDKIAQLPEKMRSYVDEYFNENYIVNLFDAIGNFQFRSVFSFVKEFLQTLKINDLVNIIKVNIKHLHKHLNKNICFDEKPQYLVNWIKTDSLEFGLSQKIADVLGMSVNEKYLMNTRVLTNMMFFKKYLKNFESCEEFALSVLSSISGVRLRKTEIPILSKNLYPLGLGYRSPLYEVFKYVDTYEFERRYGARNRVSLFIYNSIFDENKDDEIADLVLDFFDIPLSKFKASLSFKDFDYFEDDLNRLNSFISKRNADVLIWGSPGFGKTELVRVIAEKNKLYLIDLNDVTITQDKHGFTDEFKKNTSADTRFLNYLNLKNMISGRNDLSVFVDEAENILLNQNNKSEINEVLGKKDGVTFWVVNDVKGMHSSLLRRFDYIFEMPKMPFDSRLALAKNLLADDCLDDLALKIAQYIQTPSEIVSAVNWVKETKDFSWANISKKFNAFQKLVSIGADSKYGDFEMEVITPNKGLSFNDYAGYGYIKEEVSEFLDILKRPNKYQKVKAIIPKGLLFAGPPGVGKTLFAQCITGELGATLIRTNGTELVGKPERIKAIFDKAKEMSPCILFIDEIDVLGIRIMKPDGSIDTEKQKNLNSLLTQIDGFEKFSGVLIIGATHRSSSLDEALMRSGRFGKTIYFRHPSLEDRKEIFQFYINRVNAEKDMDLNVLAKLSAGFSSADIAQTVNEAAISTAFGGREVVTVNDVIKSVDKVFFGTTANGLPMSEMERFRTAVHEAGHAFIAVKNDITIQRATIHPHHKFLGMVNLEIKEGEYGWSLNSLRKHVEILLAGLAAEKVVLGNHKTGVVSDLNTANSLIKKCLYEAGMSSELSLYQSFSLSERHIQKIEDEVTKILDDALKANNEWLTENKEILLKFAKKLLENRSLEYQEIKDWFEDNMKKEVSIDVFNECRTASEMLDLAIASVLNNPQN